MMALGHEDLNGQLRVAEQGGIQPLVRLLRIPRTSSQVTLAVVCALASLCIGQSTTSTQPTFLLYFSRIFTANIVIKFV